MIISVEKRVPEPIQIALLGGLSCRVAGRPLILPSSAKTCSLLAYLALQPGMPQRRDYLAYTLWSDSTEEQARANLRRAIFDLSHAAPGLASALLATYTTVAIADDTAAIDTQEFSRLTARLPVSGSVPEPSTALLDELGDAVALYQGDLLPELLDDWFSRPRERFRRNVRLALLTLVTGYRQRGDLSQALASAQRLTALDPFDEEAHRLLMDLQWRSGRASQARDTFGQLARRLRDELATEPEPETLALARRTEQPARIAHRHTTAAALAPASFNPPRWSFVGREAELAAILDAWREAVEGRGKLLVVTGEAGIGKTRLVQEAIGRLTPRPRVVLGGRARPESTLPFEPLIGAVRQVLATLPIAAWPVLLPPWDNALAAFLPELGSGAAATGVRQRHVQEAWTLLLRRGFGQPVVLALDDLPWADEATLAYLKVLADTLAESALLVLATARTGDLGPESAAGALLEATARRGVLGRLPLEALSPADSEGLIQAVGGRLAAPYTRQLAHRANGHPLFLVELARAARTAGFALEGFRLPESVRALVADVARRLSPDSRMLLDVLSVLGSAPAPLLADVLGWSGERLDAALVAPLRHQLLTETGASLSFAHDLLREAVSAGLAGPERRHWHRQAARALARQDPADATARAADHYLAAGDELLALPHLLSAAEAALRQPTPNVAASRFERAADLAQRWGRETERARALLGLGRSRLHLGQADLAAEAYATARTEAQVTRDDGVQLQAIAGRIEAIGRDQLKEGLALFEQALALPRRDGDEAVERGLVRATLAVVPIYFILRPRWSEGRAHVQRARELAERHGDLEGARQLSVHLVQLTTHFQGPWPAALAEYRRLGSHVDEAWLLTWMGRTREARLAAELGLALARRRADYFQAIRAQIFLATALGLAGDYRSGFELHDHVWRESTMHLVHIQGWQPVFRLLINRELGLWERVRADAEAHLRAPLTVETPGGPLAGLVEAARLQAEARLGDTQSTWRQLQSRAEQPTHPEYRLDRLMTCVAAADVALLADRPTDAVRLATEAAGLAEAIGAQRELAHAYRLRALGLHQLGDADAARETLVLANRVAAEVAEPALSWRLRAVEAQIWEGAPSARALLTAEESIRAQLPVDLRSSFGVGESV